MTLRVIVVGGGISGLAAARHLERAGHEVLLLEATDRLGGLVETERRDGLVIEHGPEGFVTTRPEMLELVHELGLGDELMSDGPAPRQTFVRRGTRMLPLPYGVLRPDRRSAALLMRSPLLRLRDKLRLTMEPIVPRRRTDADESVGAFVERRFGRGLRESIVEPLLGGIHGGSCDDLSAAMILPHLRAVESAGRSVGFAAARTSAPEVGRVDQATMVSLRSGMQAVVDRLADQLEGEVRLETPVHSVEPIAGGLLGWSVETPEGRHHGDALVLAVPPPAAARLLRPVDDILADRCDQTLMGDSQTVTLIWPAGTVAGPDAGTGFIVPRREGGELAACSWVTSKWHDRATDGSVMMRCFMRAPGRSDAELARSATEALAEILEIRGEPSEVIVRQRSQALAVMQVHHLDRMRHINERLDRHPGLALAGAGIRGAGLPACVDSGRRAAESIIEKVALAPLP